MPALAARPGLMVASLNGGAEAPAEGEAEVVLEEEEVEVEVGVPISCRLLRGTVALQQDCW